jgi:hypothetical protein
MAGEFAMDNTIPGVLVFPGFWHLFLIVIPLRNVDRD